MSRIDHIIETLEAEKAELLERVQWLDAQIETFREHAAQAEPAKPGSARRATGQAATGPAPSAKRGKRLEKAQRARSRRATVKPLKRDLAADITGHLAKHPNSTAGDIARALDANRNSVATKLTQMTKLGTLTKAERGYAVASQPPTAT